MDFNDVIGHKRIIENLQNSIRNKNVAHSYLFVGSHSLGKVKTAKAFAKTLLCEKGNINPCNKCSSCLKFDSGNHPDFHIVPTDNDSFKKEQMDETQRAMRLRPYEGKKKIFILEDVQRITKNAANSFLKTLEEPPSYVTIILTVNNRHSLLPTIVSRCQILKFTPVENEIIEDILIKDYNKSSEETMFISAYSNGIIGKAINMAQSEDFKKLREDTISVIDEIINSDKSRVFFLSDFFTKKHRENIEEILDMLQVWFRDLLLMKKLRTDKFIINKDKISILTKQCNKLSKVKIHDIIDVLEKTKENINSNVNYELAIEVMLLKIQEV